MRTVTSKIIALNQRYPGMMWGMTITGCAGLFAGPLASVALTVLGAALGLAVDMLRRQVRPAPGREPV